MQAKINKRTVDASVAGQAGDLWIWDTEIMGFGVRVRPNGRKSYIVEYRPGSGGRVSPKRRYTIGQHGSPWTPDTARDEARRILSLVAAKHDPVAERSLARGRDIATVAEVSAEFIEKYAKRRQRSWRETERVLQKEVTPAFGNKPIGDVTRQDVLRLLDRIADRGPIMANRTLAYTRRLFGWACERGYIDQNPCAGLPPPGEAKSRDRVLDDMELLEVWRAAEEVGSVWEPLIKMLILTAQRRNEVAEMCWSEIDFSNAIWSLPANRTKGKRAHEVPLCRTAIEILSSIPRSIQGDGNGNSAGSSFVLTTTGRTPVSGFSKAKKAIDEVILKRRLMSDVDANQMPRWTFHDLRRTATTGMARLGIHPHIADAILNHQEGAIRGVAAIYNRHAYLDERRRALHAWEAYVLAAVRGQLGGENVVPLSSRRGG